MPSNVRQDNRTKEKDRKKEKEKKRMFMQGEIPESTKNIKDALHMYALRTCYQNADYLLA